MTFGETLRCTRRQKGDSLRGYAKELGLSAGQLSRIERDMTHSINALLLKRLSERYGLSSKTLMDLLEARGRSC